MSKSKLGFTAHLENNQYRTSDYTVMRLWVFPIRQVEHMKRDYRMPAIWDSEFRAPRIHVRMQCNNNDPAEKRRWYGASAEIDGVETLDDMKAAASVFRRILGDTQLGHCNLQPFLERLGREAMHLEGDSRISNYIEVSDAGALKNMRAYYDVGVRDSGCTVHAYTWNKDATEKDVQDAFKRAFCHSGAADDLLKWVESGMRYEDLTAGWDRKEASGIPFERYIDYPQAQTLEPVEVAS